jgi:hypothetical protein
LSFSAADFVTKSVARKLDSGLPQRLVTRVYAYTEKGERPITVAALSCRVVYDLWEGVYRVQEQTDVLDRSRTLPDQASVVRACLDDVCGCAVALSAPAPRQPVLGVGAAHPVDGDHDLCARVVQVSDGLVDDGAHDPFLQPDVCVGRRPHALQVPGELGEGNGRESDLRRGGGIMLGDPPLDLGDAYQCPVPPGFQFAGDQAILRIGGVVLTQRAVGSVARGLEIADERIPGFVPAHGRLRLGRLCGVDCGGLHDGEQRRLDDVVDTQAAEGDAGRLAVVEPPANAGVAGDPSVRAGVLDGQLPAAAAATQQP